MLTSETTRLLGSTKKDVNSDKKIVKMHQN